MIIKKDTEMLLFRYSNFSKHDFLPELENVLKEKGAVWMLKAGKRSSLSRLEKIRENGGWLVLRAPKADGSKSYIAKYTEVSEDDPTDGCYPEYYDDIIYGDDEKFLDITPTFQWFKLILIKELSEKEADKLVVAKTEKSVNEVIVTTRTAVMFIKNSTDINI